MRPLREEPDVLPIHAEVQRQLNVALREAGLRPGDLRISFSPHGQTRALSQTVPGFDPWGCKAPPTHYLGLPFVVTNEQSVDVVLQTLDGRAVLGGVSDAQDR